GDRKRLPAGAGDVPCRLEHGERTAGPWVGARQPPRRVQRDREAAQRRPQPENRAVEPGPPDGARADEVVVALEDGGAAADVLRMEEVEQRLARRRACGDRGRGGRRALPQLDAI